jgi:hypothetical protein
MIIVCALALLASMSLLGRLPNALAAGPEITASPGRQIFYEFLTGTPRDPVQSITLRNDGDSALQISSLTITGPEAAQFAFSPAPPANVTLNPTESIAIPITFNPASVGPKGAFLSVVSNDADEGTLQLPLRGLGINSNGGGANEPSLQWILDTFETGINTGDATPADNVLGGNSLAWGDEVLARSFVKAGAGPVTLEPIASFGPTTNNPALRFGWYPSNDAAGAVELFTVANTQAQGLLPAVVGSTSFDPGAAAFGFYSAWPAPANSRPQSEDHLNTWEANLRRRHKIRVYPLQENNVVVPNAYVVATEEIAGGTDFQDIVVIARNVRPAPLDLVLEFDRVYPGTLFDKDSQPIGFLTTQRNKNDSVNSTGTTTSFDATQIDLNPAAGTLVLTTTRTSSAQTTAWNNLINGLQVPFDGATQPFTITTQLIGPLTQIVNNTQQAGVFFGPDQDNFVKVIVARLGGTNVIEFYHENAGSGTSIQCNLPGLATIQTLDLYILGDPATGVINGAYQIVTNSGNTGIQLIRNTNCDGNGTITLTGARKNTFFNSQSWGMLNVSGRDGAASIINFTFERFAITFAGPVVPTSTPTSTATATATNTATATATATGTPTETPCSCTATVTGTTEATKTATATETGTAEATKTTTATEAGSATATGTPTTQPGTLTPTATGTSTTQPGPAACPDNRRCLYLPLVR